MKPAFFPQIGAKSHVECMGLTASIPSSPPRPNHVCHSPAVLFAGGTRASNSSHPVGLVHLPWLCFPPRKTQGMVPAPPRTLLAQQGDAAQTFPKDAPKSFGRRGGEDGEPFQEWQQQDDGGGGVSPEMRHPWRRIFLSSVPN